jgi:hypothetical protein
MGPGECQESMCWQRDVCMRYTQLSSIQSILLLYEILGLPVEKNDLLLKKKIDDILKSKGESHL